MLYSVILIGHFGNAQTTFPANAKILCLGDSRVEGDITFESYRYEFWKDLVDCNWTFDLVGEESDPLTYPIYLSMTFDPDHQGIGGSTTSDVLSDLPSALATTGAVDIVLLGIGGNDALNDGSPSVPLAIANINSIIDLLQANNPNVVILLEQIAPGMTSIMTPDLILAINNFNSQIPTVAANQTSGGSTVIPVDMNTGWQDSYLADDVHYNAIGAEIVATRYSDVLKTLYNCGLTSTPDIESSRIELYPNPVNSILTVEIPNNVINSGTLEVHDVTGKKILSQQVHETQNTIDVSMFAPGNYIILFSNPTGIQIREKLIIQ